MDCRSFTDKLDCEQISAKLSSSNFHQIGKLYQIGKLCQIGKFFSNSFFAFDSLFGFFRLFRPHVFEIQFRFVSKNEVSHLRCYHFGNLCL